MSRAKTVKPSPDSPPREPEADHQPFSWLNEPLANDRDAQFVALTMDVCRGVQVCLELIHSDMLVRNANQWADPGQEVAPILAKHNLEQLLLLATASTRMLSDQAEERIDSLNERARSR